MILGILFGRKNADIGGIVIDASVTEDHDFECDITENPVEEGAEITDHVQLKAASLSIQGVISDAPLGFAIIGNIQNLIRSVTTLFGKTSRSIDAFNQMLELRRKRIPFTVTTGLKKYDNMVFAKLNVNRTASTSDAIHFTATLKEIRIAKSQTASNPPMKPDIADRAAKTKDSGQKVTDPVPSDNPLNTNPSQTTQESDPSKLFKVWDKIKNRGKPG